MWSKCSHQPYGGNILRMLLGKFQMIANCYGGSNVLHMLILHSKCSINVPTSCVWPGTCRNIWNVPNLLSVGKWQVPSTRAYNVLKMFSLVSRPPRPQWVIWMTRLQPESVRRLLLGMERNPLSQKKIRSSMWFTKVLLASWSARCTSSMPSLPLQNPTIFPERYTTTAFTLWRNPRHIIMTTFGSLQRPTMDSGFHAFVLWQITWPISCHWLSV